MRELKLFEEIANTPSKNDKIQLLKNNDSETLRALLVLTYNKYQTYHIKQLDMPEEYNVVQPDITKELSDILQVMSQRTATPTQGRLMLKKLMAKCTEEGAKWVRRIVERDLNIGIDESTINKAFPGLIPVFEVQLAHPVYKGGVSPRNYWPELKYPLVCEEKLDGLRCVAVVSDDKVTLYSREGRMFDDRGAFTADILKLRPGTSYVLDGELIAHTLNPKNKIAVKNKDGNWPYEQAKSMIKNEATSKAEIQQYVGFFVWDVLELDFFLSQGKKGTALPLERRKLLLTSLFERGGGELNTLRLVPNHLAWNEQEVRSLFRQVRNQGGEGLMLKDPTKPYEFKRSSAVLKFKEFYTADLRIIGAYEGERDSKFEGMMGGLTLSSDDGSTHCDCGSGLDEDLRFELWMQHKRGELVGKIVEVSYQERTTDGSLRFPVFQRFRDDKTTTNVEG